MVKQGEGLPAHVWRHQALARDDVQLRALVPDQAVEAALGVAGTTQADALTLCSRATGPARQWVFERTTSSSTPALATR